MTAEPGRILDQRVLVVQDGTGGILIRLAKDAPTDDLARGRIVQATGELAAPYGNLELRLDDPDDLTAIGTGGLPEPEALTSDQLGEPSEGILATVTGEIEDVDRGSGGSLTVVVSDGHGEARVVLDKQLEEHGPRLVVGRRLTATGIVGQRASRSGRQDGYRLWPRDGQDLVVDANPQPTPTPAPRPTATPRPTPTPRPTRSPRPSAPPLTRIRDASFGSTVTVEGVVTAPAGLLDSDGRRVTIQDGSGGILLRLPEDQGAPQLGARIRASGEVATYYGAPQLEAADAPRLLDRRRALPVVMRRAPGADDEWRLVRVTVRIVDLSRSGETWRAEASLGAGGSLPVVGVATSEIPSTALEEGRSATITGIVKRAYPTASDQRYAVVPRFAADIELGPVARNAPDDPDGETGAGDPSGASPWLGGSASPATGTAAGGVVDATLVQLPSLVGRDVRIGGTLERVEGSLLTLDDGTASADRSHRGRGRHDHAASPNGRGDQPHRSGGGLGRRRARSPRMPATSCVPPCWRQAPGLRRRQPNPPPVQTPARPPRTHQPALRETPRAWHSRSPLRASRPSQRSPAVRCCSAPGGATAGGQATHRSPRVTTGLPEALDAQECRCLSFPEAPRRVGWDRGPAVPNADPASRCRTRSASTTSTSRPGERRRVHPAAGRPGSDRPHRRACSTT